MLDELIASQAGVIARWQALTHLGDAVIRQHVRAGRWRRVHRGVFMVASGRPTRVQRRWIASLAVGAGAPALLAGVTALELLGLRGFRRDQVHVLLPSERRADRPPPGVEVHRTNQLPEGDIAAGPPVGEPPCTGPLRSLVDAASWAPGDDEARAMVVAAIRQRLVVPDGIPAMLSRLAPVRRSRLIAITAADMALGARTLTEVEYLAEARRHGFPRAEVRRTRVVDGGRRTHLDVRYEPYGVRVIVDGSEPAGSLVERARAALVATGWPGVA